MDVIAFSPIVEDGWDNVLTEAKKAGIPVILVDRDISTKEEGLTIVMIGRGIDISVGAVTSLVVMSCVLYLNKGGMLCFFILLQSVVLSQRAKRKKA